MKKVSIAIGLIAVFTLLFNSSCAAKGGSFDLKKSLSKAGETIGIEIPWPHYLPQGYAIADVSVVEESVVRFTMSQVPDEKEKQITLEIQWHPEPYIPYKVDLNGWTAKFNGITGQLYWDGDTNIGLVWNWIPERYKPALLVLKLSAPKDLPVSELTAIASSINWD